MSSYRKSFLSAGTRRRVLNKKTKNQITYAFIFVQGSITLSIQTFSSKSEISSLPQQFKNSKHTLLFIRYSYCKCSIYCESYTYFQSFALNVDEDVKIFIMFTQTSPHPATNFNILLSPAIFSPLMCSCIQHDFILSVRNVMMSKCFQNVPIYIFHLGSKVLWNYLF